MKRQNITSFSFIFYLAAIAATFALLIYSIAKDSPAEKNQFLDFNESWYLDEELTLPADTSEPSEIVGYETGKALSFFARLPEIPEKGFSLNFRLKNSEAEIYFVNEDGSRELVQKTADIQPLYGKSVGTVWIDIPLDTSDSGRLMEILFTPCYDDSGCYLDNFKIGRTTQLISNAIGERVIGAATCIIMLFTGILLIVLHFLVEISTNSGNKEMLYLGIFAAMTSCWALVETKFLNFFLDNTGAVHNLACMSLMLIILPLFMFYQRDMGQKSNRLVPTVCIISVLNFLVCCVLHFAGIKDFHETLTLTHITIGIACICILYMGYVRCFKCKNVEKTDIVSSVGMAVIAIFAAIDIVRYRMGGVNDSELFTRIGLLIYIITLGICTLSYTAQMVKKGAEAELISRLAYEDGLTGMGNRTAYKERIAALDKNGSYTFFMFDINNLKYVNDNIGHQTGDKMIIAASEVIKQVFSPLGKCYRIGGDEFVCIAETAVNTEMYQNVFFEELRLYRENNNPDFPLAVALGSQVCRAGEDIQTAIHNADQKMYTCKAELKAKDKSILKIKNVSPDGAMA